MASYCGIRALQRKEIDLAHRAEVGADTGLKTRRKGHHGQSLQHPLPVLEIVRVVVKPDDHDGQPGNGHGPQVGAIRDAVHHVFDGDGDLLLHFLRGPARPLRDDPGVIIGDVGIGLDRKMVELNDAQTKQKDAKGQHEPAMAQGEIDNSANHLYLFP